MRMDKGIMPAHADQRLIVGLERSRVCDALRFSNATVIPSKKVLCQLLSNFMLFLGRSDG